MSEAILQNNPLLSPPLIEARLQSRGRAELWKVGQKKNPWVSPGVLVEQLRFLG